MASNADAPQPSRFITIAEVKDIIEREQGERAELSYEQKLALDHATHFVRLPAEQSNELAEKLLKLGGRMNEYYAHRLADLLPSHPDDVRAVYARERSAPDNEELEKILAVVQEYR